MLPDSRLPAIGAGPLTEILYHADFVSVHVVFARQCVTPIGRD